MCRVSKATSQSVVNSFTIWHSVTDLLSEQKRILSELKQKKKQQVTNDEVPGSDEEQEEDVA